VDTGGIKPWQLSHVRSLEAQGYRLVSVPEHQNVDADSSSYAPYLVSDRTLSADRQVLAYRCIQYSVSVIVEFKVTLHEQVRCRGTLQY